MRPTVKWKRWGKQSLKLLCRTDKIDIQGDVLNKENTNTEDDTIFTKMECTS